MIFNFSFFISSIDAANESDCNDVAGDEDAIDAVVVIDDCDRSAFGSPFASNDDKFSLEFWLILSAANFFRLYRCNTICLLMAIQSGTVECNRCDMCNDQSVRLLLACDYVRVSVRLFIRK